MTLEEQLKQLVKGNHLVKLGTRKGAGFFYCDKLTKETHKEIVKISRSYLSRLKSELKVKKDLWANFDDYWKDRMKNIKKILSKRYREYIISKAPKNKQDNVRKALEQRVNDLPEVIKRNLKEKKLMKESLPKKIVSLEKAIQSFVPFLERDIVETYNGISIDEPNCKIVIIKGNEVGDYSTVIEYQDRDLPSVLKRRIGWQNKVS